MKRRNTILYSELIIDELLPKYTAKEIEERCFKHLRAEHLLKKADGSTTQLTEIENIAKDRRLPWTDVAHAILARDNQATVITRDAHFQQLADVVESLKPENVP
jgi:hypothetical protein